jgi:hypothetical protein
VGIGDVRYTVLQVVNEVQRKLGLGQTGSLGANQLSIEMVDFINDVCNDLSDFGNWQETLVTSNVTCVSGQVDYSINTSANIKNIEDIYFSQRRGSLRNITIDEMRVFTTVTITGTPTQFTIFGTDSNGNPLVRVRPTPAQSEDGGIFSVLYYVRTPLYTTSDASTVIPFPARVVVLGVLARVLLNESSGAPTDRYTATFQDYVNARKEALNRFNGDTGWNVSFTPSLVNRRRR